MTKLLRLNKKKRLRIFYTLNPVFWATSRGKAKKDVEKVLNKIPYGFIIGIIYMGSFIISVSVIVILYTLIRLLWI